MGQGISRSQGGGRKGQGRARRGSLGGVVRHSQHIRRAGGARGSGSPCGACGAGGTRGTCGACGAGNALGTGSSCGTGDAGAASGSCGALGTGGAGSTSGTGGSHAARGPLAGGASGARHTGQPLNTLDPLRAGGAHGALGTLGALQPLHALGTCGPGGPGLTGNALGALRSLGTGHGAIGGAGARAGGTAARIAVAIIGPVNIHKRFSSPLCFSGGRKPSTARICGQAESVPVQKRSCSIFNIKKPPGCSPEGRSHGSKIQLWSNWLLYSSA